MPGNSTQNPILLRGLISHLRLDQPDDLTPNEFKCLRKALRDLVAMTMRLDPTDEDPQETPDARRAMNRGRAKLN